MLVETDSTIALPPQSKTAVFFNERFMGARHDEGCYETNILPRFLDCKGLSNDDGRVAYSWRYGLELVSKPAMSLIERLGGLPWNELGRAQKSFRICCTPTVGWLDERLPKRPVWWGCSAEEPVDVVGVTFAFFDRCSLHT